MNEWESQSEREQELINYLRTERGPCPDDETLIGFHEGQLPPGEVERIRVHVGLCGSCQVAMETLDRFDQCQAGELPEAPDWPVVERRSRDRFAAFLKSQRVDARERPSFWEKLRAVVLQPVRRVSVAQAVAYLLVLALAYPAYRGLFGKPEVVTRVGPEKPIVELEKPSFAIVALKTFELRLPERAPRQEPSVLQLNPDEPLVGLSFFVPISERPEFVYDVEIRDGRGQVVAAEKAVRSQDEFGNFLLVCRRDLFSLGEYELHVSEENKTTQAVRREFSFSFAVLEK